MGILFFLMINLLPFKDVITCYLFYRLMFGPSKYSRKKTMVILVGVGMLYYASSIGASYLGFIGNTANIFAGVSLILLTFLLTYLFITDLLRQVCGFILYKTFNSLSNNIIKIAFPASQTEMILLETTQQILLFILAIAGSGLLIVVLVVLLRHHYKIPAISKIDGKIALHLMTLPIGSYILSEWFVHEQTFNSLELAIATFGLLVVNIVTIDLFYYMQRQHLKVLEQTQLLEQQRSYQEQVSVLTTLEERTRRFRHDLNNQLMPLLAYDGDSVEEMKQTVKDLITPERLEEGLIVHTGNVLIDSLINYKFANYKEQKIDLTINATVPSTLPMKDDEIAIILGNLIDNAIEASMHLRHGRKINIRLYYQHDTLFFTIQNAYDGQIKVQSNQFVTRKKDTVNHGLGLMSVELIVKSYDGLFKVKYDQAEFLVDIHLPS